MLTRHVHTCLSVGSLDFESVFFVPRLRSDTNRYYHGLKVHLVFSPPCFSFFFHLLFFHYGCSAAPAYAVMPRKRTARARWCMVTTRLSRRTVSSQLCSCVGYPQSCHLFSCYEKSHLSQIGYRYPGILLLFVSIKAVVMTVEKEAQTHV